MLIIALLIVAMVAALSIKFASEYQLGISRAESRWHGLQARAYLQGMEALAIKWLEEDDASVDYYGEGWDMQIPYEVEGGWLVGALTDASSQFNLNSLHHPFEANKPADNPERYNEAQRRFIRLLQALPETPLALPEATAVLEAIVDWMDADEDESGFGGAETNFYQSQDPAYRSANLPFVSVEELRLVRFITPVLMRQLRPYITVIPTDATLNINTLQPLLARTLNASDSLMPVDLTDAANLLENKPTEGFYKDVNEFAESWKLLMGNVPFDTTGLGVNTHYFWLRAQVDLVNQQRVVNSLLHRSNDKIRVIRRSEGF